MPTALDVLSLFFTVHDYTQEYLMLTSDLAAFAAILVFMGGIVFWLMLMFAAVLGLCRGVKRLYDSARDVFAGRRVSIPQNES